MAASSELPFTVEPDAVRLAVRLTPRADRNAVGGVAPGEDGRAVWQVRVTAPPVEGQANAALVAYLADVLGLRRSAVTLVAGESARVKRLSLAGDREAIARRLLALM